tara:strand:- start:1680 stop:3263 length:1584 start_codon:yes stop_codon:yes gene_type:complete
VVGYSKIFKYFVLKEKDKNFYNLEIFYGFFLLIFLSLFINFFTALKNVQLLIFLIGGIAFTGFLLMKNIKIKNLVSFLTILLIIIFVSHHHWPNIDTEVYHLQIINKTFNEKIIFGLANIEEKYGMNSVWQIFLSLFNSEIVGVKILYLINIFPIAIFFNQYYIEIKSNKSLSKYFLLLSSLFIITFSIIHPANNGIILNHLGSTEVDLLGGFLFIIVIYIGLKLLENFDKNLFNLLFVITSIVVLSKPSYLILTFFPLLICYLLKKNPFTKLNIFLIFFGILAFIRGFINSGCFLFPAKVSCVNTFWSLDPLKVEIYENIVLGSARDNPLRLRYTDFDYLIHSNEWIIPWFKNYFFTTSLLQIFFIFLIFSLFLLLYFKLKKIIFFNQINTAIIIFFIFCALFWFRVPEIRFGFGWIISLSIFIPAYYLLVSKIDFNSKKIFSLLIVFPLILILKNYKNIYIFSQNKNPMFNYQYEILDNFDNKNYVKIKTPHDRCVDIDEYCTYYIFDVSQKKINGYNFFYQIRN